MADQEKEKREHGRAQPPAGEWKVRLLFALPIVAAAIWLLATSLNA